MDVAPDLSLLDSQTSPLIAAPPPTTASGHNPWWKWSYLLDYLAILLSFGSFLSSYLFFVPINLYFFKDDEDFMYPHKTEELIGTEMAMILSYSPQLVVVPFLQYWYRSWHDVHHSFLGLLEASALNALVTGNLWNWVGRQRPDFFAACNPLENGVCSTPDTQLEQERRSFPSGHASFAFCALLYLSLYLWGKFNPLRRGSFFPALALAISPLLLALYITATRLADNRHSPTDALAGAIIGVVCAVVGYRAQYPPLNSPNSEIPILRLFSLKQIFAVKPITSAGAINPLDCNLV